MQRQPATIDQGCGKACQNRHAYHRRNRRTDCNGARIGAAVGITRLTDLLLFKVFGRKGFDGGQAEQIIVQAGADIASGFAYFCITWRQPFLEPESTK